MKKRKTVTMLLTVTVPAWMTAAQARREVRSLVTHQCNWDAHPGQVKASKCTPAEARP